MKKGTFSVEFSCEQNFKLEVPMNNFTTQLNELLLTNNYNLEIACKELIRSNLEIAINELLQTELTAVLKYEKYERNEGDNYRNGSYLRDFNTAYGILKIKMPRDRKNEFNSPLVPKYERKDSTTEDTILKLFQTGLTNDEISNIVEALYEKKYSRGTVSNITNQVVANIDKFKARTICSHYAVIYTDATCISLRRDSVAKEAVYIALGIRPDGNKEVLGYRIAPTESCEVWKELLLDLKERGLKTASLFCTDGLAGFTNVVEELFNNPKIQRCLVHVSRNIAAKVRVKDRKAILEDFKAVYNKETLDDANSQYELFKTTWSKYPTVIKALDENKYLFTFYEFPKEIRASIYTTNIIEGFNKQIKRKTNRKEQFPTEESLEKFLVSIFEDYNAKFLSRIHKGFAQVPEDIWK